MNYEERKNEILSRIPAEIQESHFDEIDDLETQILVKMREKYDAFVYLVDGFEQGEADAEDLARIAKMLRAEGHEEAYTKFNEDESGERCLVDTNVFDMLDAEMLNAFEKEIAEWAKEYAE